MKASSHINAAEADENQRNWTKEQYDRRNDQGEKFYDWYRRHLNFEIDRDGNVRQPGYSGKINERFDRRVAELGAKPLDTRLQEKYLPNRIVRFIVSGDTEVMRRMAFGSQNVNFLYESETNSRVRRKEDIEKWAKAVHRFMCGKYGAGNIVGFDVHLDEHSPHIHCSVIPVGQRPDRKTGKLEETISFKSHFGHSLAEGSLVYQTLHTELYEQVNRHLNKLLTLCIASKLALPSLNRSSRACARRQCPRQERQASRPYRVQSSLGPQGGLAPYHGDQCGTTAGFPEDSDLRHRNRHPAGNRRY